MPLYFILNCNTSFKKLTAINLNSDLTFVPLLITRVYYVDRKEMQTVNIIIGAK